MKIRCFIFGHLFYSKKECKRCNINYYIWLNLYRNDFYLIPSIIKIYKKIKWFFIKKINHWEDVPF